MACTMGPGLLDYRLSDAISTPPGAETDLFEKLAILPAPHWPYDTDRAPDPSGTRESHGLPGKGFVFCCFNQAFKFCPDSFRVWLRLLREVPGSVLWLLDPGPVARSNLEQEAKAAGVEARRLCYAPRVPLAAHLGRQRHADLFLDTLHYGAHTTAADALHAGVPVLTCPGKTMAARLCATMVTSAGLSELVVQDLAAYERKALEVATTPELADALKIRLRNARAHMPFFQMHDRVRAVERAFRAMVERHRAGLQPAMLHLE
jgi:predicted O-linked N-acetylglucosamine transferase (SPINDLY family)